MQGDFIYLPDVQEKRLIPAVSQRIADGTLDRVAIHRDWKQEDFILTFPDGITHDDFFFFFCSLMAPDTVESTQLKAWFHANEAITNAEQGDFTQRFATTGFSKRILLTGEHDADAYHQYGVIEDGREIHFCMDGSFKVYKPGALNYFEPQIEFEHYRLLTTIER